MAVEIKFDANQQYQRDAIDSVVELFAGQDAVDQAMVPLGLGGVQDTLEGFQEVVFGNTLSLEPATIETNLRRVQDRPVGQEGEGSTAAIPEAYRQEFTGDAADLDFSVEMETGTGKTYVYLRTIAELRLKYGFTKFVIVVPSVAIREGVLSSLRMLKEHIRDLYDGLQYDSYVYDSRHLTRVRQFATVVAPADHGDQHRLLHEGDERDQPADRRDERVRADRVPPGVPAGRGHGRAAEHGDADPPGGDPVAAPLFKLRYSATHRDLRHLVYRLTPVDAYDLRLVKRIGVLSITKDEDLNEAYVEVIKINATPGGVTATARIHKATKQGTKPTQRDAAQGRRPVRAERRARRLQRMVVEDIHAAHDGGSGTSSSATAHGVAGGRVERSADDQHQRLMIRQAVESHFEKELQLQLQERREDDRRAAQAADAVLHRPRRELPPRGRQVPRRGSRRSTRPSRRRPVPGARRCPTSTTSTTATSRRPTRGCRRTRVRPDTKDAESAFERIMQNKEELLSFDEPLRFIFSHSALVEGWDNPNVFTICNLQDGTRDAQASADRPRAPTARDGRTASAATWRRSTC